MKRKLLVVFGVLILLGGLSFVLRYQLLVGATKIFLGNTLPKNLAYDKIQASNQKVTIQGLRFSDEEMEMMLDGVEFELDFQKVFRHPGRILHLYHHGLSNWRQFLVPIKDYGLNLNIQTGILKLRDERYYFQFKHGEKKHEIGTLFASHDPGLMQHPFLTMKFHIRGDQIISQVSLNEVNTDRLLRLASFTMPNAFSGFSKAQGSVQVQSNLVFEENGELQELSSRFRLGHLELTHPSSNVAIKMDALFGDINYTLDNKEKNLPLWKQVQGEIFLENGRISKGDEFTLSKLQGSISCEGLENPKLALTGELANQEKPLFLELKGKGAVHEDHSYWLEFGLALNDLLGTNCSAFLSVCSPEKESLVVQIEANNLLPQQVEMLKGYFARSMPRLKEWQILEGKFGGKLVALFEKGNLSHFEMQDMIGENVSISSGKEPIHFAKIKGEGRLFSDLNFEMELPTFQFFSFISPELKQAYSNAYPDDQARINATVKFKEKYVETSASVDFFGPGESLQFGFKSKAAFPGSLEEVTEAWARSAKLSHRLYAPLVQLIGEDLQIYGDVDLLATYDGKNIECSLQVDQFLAKHPLLDLKAKSIGEKEKTVGRVKLRYNPKTGQFEGNFPIKKGEAYDRQYGLYFASVEGDFQINAAKISGHLAHADVSWDSVDLVKGLSLHFSLGDKYEFNEVRAELALPSTRKYQIHAPRFDPTTCEIHLFEDKKEIAHFKGDLQESWRGSLNLAQLGQKFPLTFSWDPVQDIAALKVADEHFTLKIKKEKESFFLQRLQFGRVTASGQFQFGEEGWEAKKFEIKTPEFTFTGLGSIHVKFPQKDEDYAFFGDLSCQIDTLLPIPIRLHGCNNVKWAFSPGMGLVMTGLDFAAEGCNVQIDHFEHLLSGKQAAHQINFSLDSKLMEKIFDVGAFPTFLRDFKICKGLSGKANFDREKGTTKVVATLSSQKGNLDLDVDWKEGKGAFSIGQGEKLQFVVHKGENGLLFDSIQGNFGRLSANLKVNKKGELKGNVSIDFSLFDELFDLPLNRLVHLWKAGTGYQFDGVFTPSNRLFDWGFKGKIKGQSFECGGYQLRSLDAKIGIEPGLITIENLDLTDDAGKMWIEEGALMKSAQTGEWMCSFPLIEIRGFQPSVLHKISGGENGSNALVLKTASVRDVRGKIDDLNALTCLGNLRFTNASKKKENPLPSGLSKEELEQLGIDWNILIPAAGEMEFNVQNGRIYLREIRNMVSEKSRSEFLPPKSGVMGYLDFDGNLFIDLLVRQKTVRSLSAPVSLKVRGTWEEPKVTVK